MPARRPRTTRSPRVLSNQEIDIIAEEVARRVLERIGSVAYQIPARPITDGPGSRPYPLRPLAGDPVGSPWTSSGTYDSVPAATFGYLIPEGSRNLV